MGLEGGVGEAEKMSEKRARKFFSKKGGVFWI